MANWSKATLPGHIFARPKIIQLGKFGAGYSKHFHQQAFLILPKPGRKVMSLSYSVQLGFVL